MATVIIPARYGSTRFPGKVMKEIGGKPIIIRVAEQCSKSIADNVIVVTDSDIIYNCVTNEGFQCQMTPSDIPTGTDRIALVAKKISDDIIINVQGDEPFIPPKLINNLIEDLENDDSLLMNTACVPFENQIDSKVSSQVKVVFDKNGYAIYFSRAEIPFSRDGIDCKRYKHIGVYGFRRDFLLEYSLMDNSALEQTEMLEQLRALENGIKIKVLVTDYKPIAVDNEDDLKYAIKYYNSLIKEQ